MILTDDNFATIVKAVELGRSLYDNLMRYIRFQMAVPLRLHRRRSWARASSTSSRASRSCRSRRCGSTSRSTCSRPSVSAGASRARASWSSRRAPRTRPSCRAHCSIWLVTAGLVMAVGTLGLITWANNTYDTAVAHTMGLITFSFFNLFFSLETAEPEADDVLERAPGEPDAAQDDRPVDPDHHPRRRVRAAPAAAGHREPDRSSSGSCASWSPPRSSWSRRSRRRCASTGRGACAGSDRGRRARRLSHPGPARPRLTREGGGAARGPVLNFRGDPAARRSQRAWPRSSRAGSGGPSGRRSGRRRAPTSPASSPPASRRATRSTCSRRGRRHRQDPRRPDGHQGPRGDRRATASSSGGRSMKAAFPLSAAEVGRALEALGVAAAAARPRRLHPRRVRRGARGPAAATCARWPSTSGASATGSAAARPR